MSKAMTKPEASKLEVVTMGCRLNAFESEVMRRHAEAAGLDDAVIVNTCAVTGEAERQARQTIRRLRRDRPDARIIVDANEGWTAGEYRTLAPVFVELGVEMVEQPFPAGDDAALAELERVLPVCADESCHDRASLPGLAGKYDMVNIKLDKTGGLTEALALRAAAREAGFRVMVGCMLGSSLAMAPAVLVAQGAEVVDLDGPLLLAEDRDPPLAFADAMIHPADPRLWG